MEHERRLAQAIDWLLAGVPGGAQAAPVEAAPPLVEAPDEVAPEPEELTPAEPTTAEIAAAAEVLVTVRTRRQIAAAVAWNSMIALAILLTLVTIGLTVAGILGAGLSRGRRPRPLLP